MDRIELEDFSDNAGRAAERIKSLTGIAWDELQALLQRGAFTPADVQKISHLVESALDVAHAVTIDYANLKRSQKSAA
ncbi:MAG TPA: hypothetical protein VIV61_09800 [Candidatus Ozemobacteraceae bacterium]